LNRKCYTLRMKNTNKLPLIVLIGFIGMVAFISSANYAMAVNQAPTLDATKSPVLNSLLEDAAMPSGAVGTYVDSIVDFAAPSGQVDNVSDPDTMQIGLAITGVSTNVSCFFTLDNGSTWISIGAVSDSNARLLAADGDNRIYCRPNPNVEGSISNAITIRAWDQTSGTDGGLGDTTVNGGATAYSVATDTVAITITPINDAPILDATKTPTMSNVNEDSPNPVGLVGTEVNTIVDLSLPSGQLDNVSEVDSSPLLGIAVIDIDSNLDCYYSLGGSWISFGAVSTTSARLLSSGSNIRIYCHAGPDVNGTFSSALTFRAWDRTNGTNGGTADTSTNGGTTAFSTATDSISLTIINTNDAAQVTNINASETYTEDTALNLNDIVISDIDDDIVMVALFIPMPTTAILSTTTYNGVTSDYSTHLGMWTVTGPIADVNVLLAGLTFTPGPNYNSNFDMDVEIYLGGEEIYGTKSFTGIPVNDAPQATNVSTAETYKASTPRNLTDIVITDADNDNITVTLTLSNQFAGSLNTGLSGSVTSAYNSATGIWVASGAVADVNALLSSLTFTPTDVFTSSFSVSVSVSDGVAAPITGSKAFSFTVGVEVPELTFDYVSDITRTSAVFHGSIMDTGGEFGDGTDTGFIYSLDDDLAPENKISFGEYSNGVTTLVSPEIIGLTCGTQYFVAIYAENSAGRGLSEVVDFTTLACSTSHSSSGSRSHSNEKPEISKSHPNGTLILDGQTVYLIKNNQRYGFRLPEEYASFGYNFNQLVKANEADMALPFETQNILKAMPGNLVLDNSDNHTVYMIGQNNKRGFTSASVFRDLGYRFDNALSINLSDYTVGNVISSSTEAHPDGSLVLDGNTVWWILGGVKQGFESQQVFDTYGFTYNLVVKANTADMLLPTGPLVKFRDGTLVNDKNSQYLISDGKKRMFSTAYRASELGYNVNNFINASLESYLEGDQI
jgi:hypothetical protein